MTEKGDRLCLAKMAAEYVGTDCLIWPYSRIGKYGAYSIRNKGTYAHVVVCTIAHGKKLSMRHQAAHRCGNTLCVNPQHLRWATPKQNCADKVLHGTDNRGEKNNMSKLTE